MKWFAMWLDDQSFEFKFGATVAGLILAFFLFLFATFYFSHQHSLEVLDRKNESLRLEVELERLKATPTKGPATP